MHLASVEPTVQLLTEDIHDLDVVCSIQQTVEEIFDEARVAGAWTITIRASDTRGRWNVAWRGPGVRHCFSFLSSAAELHETVCRHVRDRVGIIKRPPRAALKATVREQ